MSSNSNVRCPNCGQKYVQYVVDETSYFDIDQILDDGTVELGDLETTIPGDSFRLVCDGCQYETTVEEILANISDDKVKKMYSSDIDQNKK